MNSETSFKPTVFGPQRAVVNSPISIAPMMDKTHRHFRYFLRLLTEKALLYTEMITAEAIIFGDRSRLLDFNELERPIALQLGGDNPEQLAEASRIAQDWGYDEINLNVGCPSDRVQNRNFGACLMAIPDHVASIVEKMRAATSLPVTVKHRIGIQSKLGHIDMQSYEEMVSFIATVSKVGCDRFSVHARIAILEGLSPKENRNIPPLRYEDVYRLKQDFPQLLVEINGGIKTLNEVDQHLEHIDAVMIGRASYDNPWILHEIDSRYFKSSNPSASRKEVAKKMIDYILDWQDSPDNPMVNPRNMLWPLLELYAFQRGTRKWKQMLSRPIPKEMSLRQYCDEALEFAPEQ